MEVLSAHIGLYHTHTLSMKVSRCCVASSGTLVTNGYKLQGRGSGKQTCVLYRVAHALNH